MAYLSTLYDDLRAVIAATWTDVVADGIYEDEHIEMIPWAELTPPFAAICVDDVPVDAEGEWGSANQVYQPQVGIYYVGAITGGSDPIRGKLEALRDALLAATITNGQIIDVTGLSWSDELDANKVFMAKDYTHRAGRVMVNLIVGVSP